MNRLYQIKIFKISLFYGFAFFTFNFKAVLTEAEANFFSSLPNSLEVPNLGQFIDHDQANPNFDLVAKEGLSMAILGTYKGGELLEIPEDPLIKVWSHFSPQLSKDLSLEKDLIAGDYVSEVRFLAKLLKTALPEQQLEKTKKIKIERNKTIGDLLKTLKERNIDNLVQTLLGSALSLPTRFLDQETFEKWERVIELRLASQEPNPSANAAFEQWRNSCEAALKKKFGAKVPFLLYHDIFIAAIVCNLQVTDPKNTAEKIGLLELFLRTAKALKKQWSSQKPFPARQIAQVWVRRLIGAIDQNGNAPFGGICQSCANRMGQVMAIGDGLSFSVNFLQTHSKECIGPKLENAKENLLIYMNQIFPLFFSNNAKESFWAVGPDVPRELLFSKIYNPEEEFLYKDVSATDELQTPISKIAWGFENKTESKDLKLYGRDGLATIKDLVCQEHKMEVITANRLREALLTRMRCESGPIYALISFLEKLIKYNPQDKISPIVPEKRPIPSAIAELPDQALAQPPTPRLNPFPTPREQKRGRVPRGDEPEAGSSSQEETPRESDSEPTKPKTARPQSKKLRRRPGSGGPSQGRRTYATARPGTRGAPRTLIRRDGILRPLSAGAGSSHLASKIISEPLPKPSENPQYQDLKASITAYLSANQKFDSGYIWPVLLSNYLITTDALNWGLNYFAEVEASIGDPLSKLSKRLLDHYSKNKDRASVAKARKAARDRRLD